MEPSLLFAESLISEGVKSFKITAFGAVNDDDRSKSKIYEHWSENQNRGAAVDAFKAFVERSRHMPGMFTLYYVPIGTSSFLRYDFKLSPHYGPPAQAQQAGISGITPDFVNQQISAAIAGVNEQWNARLYAMEQEREKKELQEKVKALEAEVNKKNSADERISRMLGSISGIFGPMIEENVVSAVNKVIGAQAATASVAGVQPQADGVRAQADGVRAQPDGVRAQADGVRAQYIAPQQTPTQAANDLQTRYERAAGALVGILGEEGAVKGLEKLATLDKSILEGLISD